MVAAAASVCAYPLLSTVRGLGAAYLPYGGFPYSDYFSD